jgi:hypothetical protein
LSDILTVEVAALLCTEEEVEGPGVSEDSACSHVDTDNANSRQSVNSAHPRSVVPFHDHSELCFLLSFF